MEGDGKYPMSPLDLQRCKLQGESFRNQVPHVYHLCDEQQSPGMGRKQLEESAENVCEQNKQRWQNDINPLRWDQKLQNMQ